jgi:hypothetical protein
MHHQFVDGSVGVGLRKVRSWGASFWGEASPQNVASLPCLVGFLFGGNPRIKPPQVKHLFKTMQFNVDITVRSRTKPTLLSQHLKRSPMSSIDIKKQIKTIEFDRLNLEINVKY